MSAPDNLFQRMAASCAERLEAAHAAGEQIDLLPADPAQALETPAKTGLRGGGGVTLCARQGGQSRPGANGRADHHGTGDGARPVDHAPQGVAAIHWARRRCRVKS